MADTQALLANWPEIQAKAAQLLKENPTWDPTTAYTIAASAFQPGLVDGPNVVTPEGQLVPKPPSWGHDIARTHVSADEALGLPFKGMIGGNVIAGLNGSPQTNLFNVDATGGPSGATVPTTGTAATPTGAGSAPFAPGAAGGTSEAEGLSQSGDLTQLGVDPADAASGATATPAATTTGGSVMDRLMNPKALGPLSSAATGFANSQAANRVQGGQLQQGYDRLMLQAQQDRNATESDALKKLAVTSYLARGGNPYNAAAAHLPYSYGFGPVAPSAAQQQGAGTLQDQVLQRLKPGGTYTPAKPDYTSPGAVENAGNYGGLGLSIAGWLKNAGVF